MISESELVAVIDALESEALRRWIEFGWVLPRSEDGGIMRFDTSDVARVRLICELHYDLRIEEDSLSVVLSLMDQLYDVRRSLGDLVAAVQAQPDDVRAGIVSLVERARTR